MHTQVLVVGAGPIGSVAARCAAEAGASVVLVDRREELSRSSPCTGLISPRTLDVLGVSSRCVIREIRSVSLHSPDGRVLDLAADRVKAVVIDRLRLERELHALAEAAGVDVRLGTEAVSATPGATVVRSADGMETLTWVTLIGADGPCSRVARWFELLPVEQAVHAVQALVEAPDASHDRIDVFLGNRVAPGFFAWAVPAEDRRLRIGVGVLPPHDPWEHLDRLLSERFPACRALSREGGPLPIAPVARAAAGSVFLVGDAAGQVKPLSGGGLYPGGVCARIVGRIAAEAARSDESSELAAAAYESQWQSAIGREVAFGTAIRRLSATLSDQDLNDLVVALDDPDLLSFLAEHADIDAFHRLPDRLAGHSSLWGKIVRLVPRIATRETAAPGDRHPVVSAPRAFL